MRRRYLLGMVVWAGLSAGCGITRPAELSAIEILDRASTALRSVNSVHFKLTATNGMIAIGSNLAARTIEGDVVRPDRVKGTAVSTFGRMTVNLSFMIVGTHQYVTNPVTKQWERLSGEVTAPNLLDPDHGAAALLKQVGDLEKMANENVGGVDCYHVRGSIAAALIAGLVGAPGTANRLAGDVWVGTGDFLPRRIRLVGPVTTTEPPGIERVLDLSNFNETVSIEPPT